MTDAHSLALEKLTLHIQQFSELDEDGARELAGSLLSQGWTRAEFVVRFPQDYFVGRAVEIMDNRLGRWLEGAVSGSVANTVQVDTEFGPRTAGSAYSIRPVFF